LPSAGLADPDPTVASLALTAVLRKLMMNDQTGLNPSMRSSEPVVNEDASLAK